MCLFVCVFTFAELSNHLCSDIWAYVKDYAYISIFVFGVCAVIHAAGRGVMFPPAVMVLRAYLCSRVCAHISMGWKAPSRGPEGDK